MRGQRIFTELIKDRGLQSPGQKGRSNALLHKRNECMIARYYYYGYYKNMCYEEIVRHLVAEFFLSPATITTIIQQSTELIIAVKQRNPVLYYFQSHWPHLKW